MPRGGKIGNVADGGLGNVFESLLRQESLVGGDNDIGHGDQPGENIVLQDVAGVILKEEIGLLLVNIEAGGTHLPCLDGGEQILRIDQRAAGGVQDDNPLLAGGKGFGVEQMVGLRRQGTVQGDDIALAEELRKLGIADIFPSARSFAGNLS